MTVAVERRLDVSALEPPEPLVNTLAAAERLQAGEYLRMRHRRFPCLLYENLPARQLRQLTRRNGRLCEVFLWREGDTVAEAGAHGAAQGLPPWEEEA